MNHHSMKWLKSVIFGLCLIPVICLGQTIQFWKFGSASDSANQGLAKWVDQWNKENPGKQVQIRFFPFGEYMDGTLLTTAFASGSGPDIFWASRGTFLQYAKGGVLADISDLLTPEAKQDFSQASIDAITVDGKQYAMPFEQEPVALLYNPELLQKAGVQVPKTWDELLSACEKLKAANLVPIVIEPQPGAYQNFTWYPFLWQTGADVTDPEMTKATFDSPGTAKALDLWRTLIQKGYAPRTATDITANVVATPFGSGQAAMQVVGMWAIQQLQSGAPKIKFDFAPLPTPSGSDPVTVYGGWSQAVSAKSKNLALAKEFTAWMWLKGTERPVEWCTKLNSKFSPRKSVLEAAKSFYDQPYLNTFRDVILPTARAEPRYPAELVKIIGDSLQAAMFRDTPGAQAAAEGQKQIEEFLKSNP
jgi:multiple sugar transport system substrate-binding protein